MSQFRIQATPPESYDGSGGFDDGLRRLLSYLNLADLRYKSVGMHYLKYTGQPSTRAQMVDFNDVGTAQRKELMDPYNNVDYPSLLFNVLVQMTGGPAYGATRTEPDDTGSETMFSTLVSGVLQGLNENKFIEKLTE